MIQAISKGIRISIITRYCGIQKHNNKEYFLFDYSINIENQSSDKIQLISKSLKVHDTLNNTETIKSDGVFGLTPVLIPQKTYSYNSFSSLISNCGSIEGHFTMTNLITNTTFNVKIPTIQLQTNCLLN